MVDEKREVHREDNRRATRLSNRAGTIGERVAVLESKMDSTEQDMRELKELVTTNFKELKEAIEQIRVRKNPVMEFLEDNWKMLVVVAAVFLGKDNSASAVDEGFRWVSTVRIRREDAEHYEPSTVRRGLQREALPVLRGIPYSRDWN